MPEAAATAHAQEPCLSCGHPAGAHQLQSHESPPTEGWMRCPVEGCECRTPWRLMPEAAAAVKAHSRMMHISMLPAWLSFLLGCAALLALAAGYRHSLDLSQLPRRSHGIGLSAATNAQLGGMLTGWGIAGAGTLCALAGLLNSHRRGFKLALALPAMIYFLGPILLLVVGPVVQYWITRLTGG